MFVLIDPLAHVVLLLVELPLLALGQVTIVSRHIGFLLVFNLLFAIFQSRSLPRRQRAVLDAVRDSILLRRLAGIHFVDARMTRIDLPRSRAGCVAVLGLSSSGPHQHQTTHCQD